MAGTDARSLLRKRSRGAGGRGGRDCSEGQSGHEGLPSLGGNETSLHVARVHECGECSEREDPSGPEKFGGGGSTGTAVDWQIHFPFGEGQFGGNEQLPKKKPFLAMDVRLTGHGANRGQINQHLESLFILQV